MKRKRVQGDTFRRQMFEKGVNAAEQGAGAIKAFAGKTLSPLARQAKNLAANLVNQMKSAATGLYYGPTDDFWAIDIGHTAISMAKLAKTDDGYTLKHFDLQQLDTDDLDIPEKKKAALVAALQALASRLNIQKKDAVVSISGEKLFIRSRTLPAVDRKRLAALARYEIQQQIPFALEEIYCDYCVLDECEYNYDVLLTVVKDSVLSVYLEALTAAGWRVHGVTADHLAAYNWLKHSGELDGDKSPIAVIDFGQKSATVLYEASKQAVFSLFDESFACESGKRILRLSHTISFDCGVSLFEDPSRKNLIEKIGGSFKYFKSQMGGAEVQKVILIGAGSQFGDLAPILSQELNVEVDWASYLLKSIRVDVSCTVPPKFYSGLAPVLGLALSCHEDVPIDINLLPG